MQVLNKGEESTYPFYPWKVKEYTFKTALKQVLEKLQFYSRKALECSKSYRHNRLTHHIEQRQKSNQSMCTRYPVKSWKIMSKQRTEETSFITTGALVFLWKAHKTEFWTTAIFLPKVIWQFK